MDATKRQGIQSFKETRAEFDRLIGNFTVSEKHGLIYAYSIPFDRALYVYELPVED